MGEQITTELEGKKAEKERRSKYQRTPTPCLVKYTPAGTYYLRARVGGEVLREALGTTVYEVARRKLVERLHELRFARAGVSGAPTNLVEALAIVRAKVEVDPSLKTSTRREYYIALERMLPGKTAAVPATALSRLTARELAPWWQMVCGAYGPQRANHLLMLVRRALKFARQAGSMVGDPTEELKRVKIKRTRLNLVTIEQFRLLAANVRAQRFQKWAGRSADWIEFEAYSGLRPGEMKAFEWEHIDEARGVLWVHGGIEGTKNREIRAVPIISDMARLLAEMRVRTIARGMSVSGKVFPHVKAPRAVLREACKRLGLPHLRIYDLRHLFATTCNAAGVDVPTFAKWLGHRDGGALAMRTYVHPHDDHSRESAAKVKF